MCYLSLISFLPLLIFTLVFISIGYRIWRAYKTNQNLGMSFPGSPGSAFSGQATANYQGVNYNYQYSPGSRRSSPYLRVSIPVRSDGEFCVVKESQSDIFFKKLGIDCEIQTGDHEFDQKYYILSNYPEFASRSFNSSDSRNAIASIISTGFTQIKHDGKMIEAKWNNFRQSGSPQPALINNTLDALISLSKNIPKNMPNPSMMGYPLWMIKRGVAIAVPAVLLAGGFLLSIWGGAHYKPLDERDFFIDSLKFSVPLFCFFIGLAVLLLKGRSHSHRELYIVFWLSLFGFPLSVYGAAMLMNGSQDQTLATSHTVKAVNKYTTRSKSGRTYHIDVASWRPDRQTEHFTVGAALYSQVTPNKSYMEVVTRPGALKYEWLCAYSYKKSEGK